ncbi:unnamed protein product [Moneuplotes crassus]|uniref:Uncharacterized protein n=1 Tax=Euplotes crassus TaxID=5936 RepID=A0AAD1U4I9_EUPCR|nr:unnamed protein product [Moneuplotes crassus]
MSEERQRPVSKRRSFTKAQVMRKGKEWGPKSRRNTQSPKLRPFLAKKMTLKQKMDYFYHPYSTKKLSWEDVKQKSQDNWNLISQFVLNKPTEYLKSVFQKKRTDLTKQISSVTKDTEKISVKQLRSSVTASNLSLGSPKNQDRTSGYEIDDPFFEITPTGDDQTIQKSTENHSSGLLLSPQKCRTKKTRIHLKPSTSEAYKKTSLLVKSISASKLYSALDTKILCKKNPQKRFIRTRNNKIDLAKTTVGQKSYLSKVQDNMKRNSKAASAPDYQSKTQLIKKRIIRDSEDTTETCRVSRQRSRVLLVKKFKKAKSPRPKRDILEHPRLF